MSIKDRYNKNIRRGQQVKDLRGIHVTGKVVGTYGRTAVVEWDDDGQEESLRGADLKAIGGMNG